MAGENTKTRILATALERFNAEGSYGVTTNHIAEAMGISPGNLYYHYRNKEEIIRALYEQLADELDKAFVLPRDRLPSLEDLEALLHTNFEILWRYRFFYRELLALLQRDPLLAERYRAVRARGFADFQQLFEVFAQAGVLRTTSKGEVGQLAGLCWMVSEFWLNSLELEGVQIKPNQLEQGVALLRLVLAPYREITKGQRPKAEGQTPKPKR